MSNSQNHVLTEQSITFINIIIIKYFKIATYECFIDYQEHHDK